MTKLRPAYVYLAVGVALIMGWFYFHIQPEYRLQLTCKGTSYTKEKRVEVDREQNVIFGVIIKRYKVLWGDGADVWTQRVSESLQPSPISYLRIKNEDGKVEITDSFPAIQVIHTDGDEGILAIFSHVTQTLHISKTVSDRVESFDGECRQNRFSGTQPW